MTQPASDWSAFPQGYSLLLNEKAQFPQDLSCWRMRIDRRRQLFVDTHLIARSSNLTRQLHPARKHAANPLVRDLWACYVHDGDDGLSLFGSGWRGRLDGGPEPGGPEARCLWTATSADGLSWDVDPEPLQGRTAVAEPWQALQGQLHGLLFEPDDPDPARRWKMILRDRRRAQGRRPSPSATGAFAGASVPIALYTSADGRRWTWAADTNLLRKGTSAFRHAGPQDVYPEGLGDVLQVRRDDALGRYVAHTKHTVGPDPRFSLFLHGDDGPRGTYEARVAGWSESDDLVHWSAPRIYAYPDAVDARVPGMYGIYEADGFAHEGLWLGCLSMTANVPDPACAATPRHASGFKRNWIRLAGSRDGRHWYYLADREAFIPNGAADAWDAHYLRMAPRATTAGPVTRGQEHWFYYHGQFGGLPGCPGLTLPKSGWQCGLGVGVVPRDRFVSLQAGAAPGELITRPLVFDGGTLQVNAMTETGGSVRAAVLEEDGTPVAGFGYDEAAPIHGDHLQAVATWGGGASLGAGLDAAGSRYVRFGFRLERARIYAFQVE